MEKNAQSSKHGTSEQWDGTGRSTSTESSIPQTSDAIQQEHMDANDFYLYLEQMRLNEDRTKYGQNETTVGDVSPVVKLREYASLVKSGHENQVADPRQETMATQRFVEVEHKSVAVVQTVHKIPRKKAPVPPKVPVKDETDSDDSEFESEMLEAYVKLAKEDMDGGHYDSAEKRWRKVLETSKARTSISNLWALVTCLEILGKSAEAVKILERIIDYSTNKAEQYSAHHRLAMTVIDLGDFQTARLHATKALKGRRKLLGKEDPLYFESMSLLAKVLEDLGEEIEAEAYRAILLQNSSSKSVSAQSNPSSSTPNVPWIPPTSRATSPPIPPPALSTSSDKNIPWGPTIAGDDLDAFSPHFMPPTRSQALPLGGCLGELTEIQEQVKNTTNLEMYNRLLYYIFFRFLTVTESGAFHEIAKSYWPTNQPPLTIALAVSAGKCIKVYQDASTSDRIALVQSLIGNGVDPRGVYRNACNPLHLAAMTGYTAIVKVLIENGADVNCMDMEAKTPMFFAAGGGFDSTMRLLVDKGARLDAPTETGTTPLMEASINGHEGIVRLLLNKGAKVQLRTLEGTTALHHAAMKGFDRIMWMLLDKGAYIDSTTNKNLTPLLGAALCGHFFVVRQLLQRGANVDAKDDEGATALTYACQGGHFEIVEILVMAGADLSTGPEGQAAATVAWNHGHQKIATFILNRFRSRDNKFIG